MRRRYGSDVPDSSSGTIGYSFPLAQHRHTPTAVTTPSGATLSLVRHPQRHMAEGGKGRRWEAFVSVSNSGLEHSSVLEEAGHLYRPRMAADLRYTTVDVDFWYRRFRTPEPDRPRGADTHIRRVNPSKSELLDTLASLGQARRAETEAYAA